MYAHNANPIDCRQFIVLARSYMMERSISEVDQVLLYGQKHGAGRLQIEP
jgi:hypothetical protein